MSSPAAAPLAGLRVIVTRPAHQAEALCQKLEAQGAEAARLPLFAIEPAGEPALQKQVLDQARSYEGWVFTSANAVRAAKQIDPEGVWPRLFAVGAATAAALAEAGHPGAIAPSEGSSSEALLALPELQALKGQRYLIVTGEAGRTLLDETLAARGAAVSSLALYRRRPLQQPAERVIAELELADAIVLTSGEAFDHLWQLLPERARPQLLALQIVLPSARVREKAQRTTDGIGELKALLPPQMSDEAIVRSLIDWRAAANAPATDAREAIQMTPSTSPGAAAAAPSINVPPRTTPPTPPKRRRPWLAVAWLLVLALAGALAYTGWLLWNERLNVEAALLAQDQALRRLARQGTDLDSDSAQMAARQSDFARNVERLTGDVAAVQGRLGDSEQLMGRLTEELQGGRTRFQLASVENLLLIASDRLQLERDVPAALKALEAADARLAQLNDPRLFAVRKALADERAALMSLPKPDLTAAALSLSSLAERAPSLPLRARVDRSSLREARAASFNANKAALSWPERLWASLREAIGSLFVLRRDDNSRLLRLLPQEDEAVVYHILILRLDSARLALLRGDAANLRESARAAGSWLDERFRVEDPGVIAAQAELERLQALQLAAAPPDTSRSLTLLRDYLGNAQSLGNPQR